MRIAIVDDEDLQRRQIYELLQSQLKQYYLPDLQFDLYETGAKLLSDYTNGKYDLLILDIYIDQENGVDVAEEIRKTDENVTIVFCTTSNEFASESYRVNARHYLLKPITEESVGDMLKRIDPASLVTQKLITLPDRTRLRLSSIKYTIYENHKVTFYLLSGNTHSVYMSQQETENLLSESDGFYKINRGTIVNFKHVRKLLKKDFQMADETMLPISRGSFKAVSESYIRYKLGTD